MNERDRIEVLALVNAYVESIHAADEERFAALWCGRDDDTMISINKDYRGQEAICKDFYTNGLHRMYRYIALVADDEPSVRPLADDVCVVVFRYHTECVRAETGEPYGIKGTETQVMRRTERGWKLAHVHYSKGA
ncbi:YybH family protein [Olsenella intestinalis]|uniref:YybH family protein n=1 Tax=Olsenella intestinalis TaxID=2930083 RepID=UPI00200ECB74|nr:nuclear transport factor 2 family protein [Olsenella intestinalis]